MTPEDQRVDLRPDTEHQWLLPRQVAGRHAASGTRPRPPRHAASGGERWTVLDTAGSPGAGGGGASKRRSEEVRDIDSPRAPLLTQLPLLRNPVALTLCTAWLGGDRHAAVLAL